MLEKLLDLPANFGKVLAPIPAGQRLAALALVLAAAAGAGIFGIQKWSEVEIFQARSESAVGAASVIQEAAAPRPAGQILTAPAPAKTAPAPQKIAPAIRLGDRPKF